MVCAVVVQNIAVFERDSDRTSSSDESSDVSDDETSEDDDADVDSFHSEQHQDKDSDAKQTTHSRQLPRIKMPKPSSDRQSRPCIEVLQTSDNNVPEGCTDNKPR